MNCARSACIDKPGSVLQRPKERHMYRVSCMYTPAAACARLACGSLPAAHIVTSLIHMALPIESLLMTQPCMHVPNPTQNSMQLMSINMCAAALGTSSQPKVAHTQTQTQCPRLQRAGLGAKHVWWHLHPNQHTCQDRKQLGTQALGMCVSRSVNLLSYYWCINSACPASATLTPAPNPSTAAQPTQQPCSASGQHLHRHAASDHCHQE
ncbi:hypothetical protein COO60DRAFT_1532686 [Scenedesmus sp. NREL 46B-D3]|nr:hypothetical protein COO60DRAFT_1532686 [Scenedesmus sp. NREL 46B-D3]